MAPKKVEPVVEAGPQCYISLNVTASGVLLVSLGRSFLAADVGHPCLQVSLMFHAGTRLCSRHPIGTVLFWLARRAGGCEVRGGDLRSRWQLHIAAQQGGFPRLRQAPGKLCLPPIHT